MFPLTGCGPKFGLGTVAALQKASFAASSPKPEMVLRSGGAPAPSPLSIDWNQMKPPAGSVGSLLNSINPPHLARLRVIGGMSGQSWSTGVS